MATDRSSHCMLFSLIQALDLCVELEGQVAFAAVCKQSLDVSKSICNSEKKLTLTVSMGSHEDTSTALRRRALPSQPLDLSVRVDAVELQDGEFDWLALVLDLLWGTVRRGYIMSSKCHK